MLSATRFVECYRNDVRQARSVEIGNKGASVALTLSDGVIEYRANEGRLERVRSVSGEADTGPFVREIHFLIENAAASGPRHVLLHAKWECLAEINPRPDASKIQSPEARILILDTALRMDAGESVKRER